MPRTAARSPTSCSARAPNRRLVVQFTNLRYHYYSDADTLDMQIVLYEESREILIQYRDLTTSPTTTATGNRRRSARLSPPAVRRTPALLRYPGRAWPSCSGPSWRRRWATAPSVSYAVTVDASTPDNTWITNTATLSSSFVSVQRAAGTLIDPVDLSASTKRRPLR